MNDAGAEFRFAAKANQYITHMRRLKNAEEPLKRFLGALQPLLRRKQLGPVLFQLPPNFKADVPLLNDFLALLPRAIQSAFEFRHESGSATKPKGVQEAQCRAVCCGDGVDYDSGGANREVHLFSVSQAKLRCQGAARPGRSC